MSTESSSPKTAPQLPARLRLTPPPLSESGIFHFEDSGKNFERAFISLPLRATTQEIDLPLQSTATLEIDRYSIMGKFTYAIGKVEKDPLTLTRTHVSDVARFIGVADRLPVHDTYKVGLLNEEKAGQILRLANMMALFNALGRNRDDLAFIPTIEQTMFHMNYADELQGARDALWNDLPLRPIEQDNKSLHIRRFGVLKGGKPSL